MGRARYTLAAFVGALVPSAARVRHPTRLERLRLLPRQRPRAARRSLARRPATTRATGEGGGPGGVRERSISSTGREDLGEPGEEITQLRCMYTVLAQSARSSTRTAASRTRRSACRSTCAAPPGPPDLCPFGRGTPQIECNDDAAARTRDKLTKPPPSRESCGLRPLKAEGRDSNPRARKTHNGFRDARSTLLHPSEAFNLAALDLTAGAAATAPAAQQERTLSQQRRHHPALTSSTGRHHRGRAGAPPPRRISPPEPRPWRRGTERRGCLRAIPAREDRLKGQSDGSCARS